MFISIGFEKLQNKLKDASNSLSVTHLWMGEEDGAREGFSSRVKESCDKKTSPL